MLSARRRLLLIPAVLFVASCACFTSQYSVTPQRYSGVRLYQVYCASCHGLEGYGDGPVAPLVKARVPDLTSLAARNGGTFPADQVYGVIDGQLASPTHGTRKMPVWGFEFYGTASDDRAAHREASQTITRLVEYLRTLQPRYYYK